jgi:E3 ubiquitin-protein ligase RAD18
MAPNDFDDVPDPTDWLETPLAGLAAVETALVCKVCKEIYKTPMITSCSHTFCSECIRRALGNDGKCPLCRTSDQELKLRNNWSLEEAVEAFVKSRAAMLVVARMSAQQQQQQQQQQEQRQQQERMRSSSPKRKLRHVSDSRAAENAFPEAKRLRSSTRLSKTRAEATTSAMLQRQDVDVIQLSDGDDDYDDESDEPQFCISPLHSLATFGPLLTCIPSRRTGRVPSLP